MLGWHNAVEDQNHQQAGVFADQVLAAGRLVAAEPQFVTELQQRFNDPDATALLAGLHAFLTAFNLTMSAVKGDGSS